MIQLLVYPIGVTMFWLLAFCVVISHAVAVPTAPGGQRIVGGELTTIDRYPFQAALLHGTNTFYQFCGGSILNSRSILTAANCFWFDQNPQNHRIRVGSTFANSGGVVHRTSQVIIHPNNLPRSVEYDVAIVRSGTVITFDNLVQPVAIAGTNYNLLDDQPVWATGWGLTSWPGGILSEQLRHVQIYTINQDICKSRYYGLMITDNMLCVGVPGGGRDQCLQDTGGPLLHNGVLVGICSSGVACGEPTYPGVNTRVSSFTTWIQANA